MVEALHDEGCGIAEHACLVVVAVGMKAIDLKIIPGSTVEFVLFLKVRLEIDQRNAWLPRYVPTSDADMKAFFGSHLHPWTPQRGIFKEEGISLALPDVRTYEKKFVGELFLQRFGTR